MTRINSKSPITLKDTEIKLENGIIVINGPLGSIMQKVNPTITLSIGSDGMINLSSLRGESKEKVLLNTIRSLIMNAVFGVNKGFERRLILVGVGYRAQANRDKLSLSLGFSHQIIHHMPDNIKVETPTQTEILIKGIDKQKVGQVAAEVRSYRPPDPYKGKGVRYANEIVILKETKKK